MAAGLLNYDQPDPLTLGLLGFSQAISAPRSRGGGVAAALSAFPAGQMQAAEMRRREQQDALRQSAAQEQMAMQRERFGMDKDRFSFERSQAEQQRADAMAQIERVQGVRAQIAAQKPELLPMFDMNPMEAVKRLFPDPGKPTIVPKGAAVLGSDNRPVFTNQEPPEQTAMERSLVAAGIDPKSPQGVGLLRAYAQKTATHAPPASMNVSYGAPFSGVGPDGREMLYQPTNRGGPPMPTGLAPPPKAGGKPTEDENKSAGYAVRMEDALNTLRTVTAQDPGAATPPILQSIVGNVSTAAANAMTPVNRQRIESAQLDALDAALTLATGAAYTKEQLASLSKSYFPQIGDKPQNIQEKQARLEKVIQTARIRAGTAAPNIDRVLGGPRAAPRSPQGMPTPGGPGAILRFDAQGNLVQ
jgi:hypothetical protein